MRDFPKKKNALKRKSPEPAEAFQPGTVSKAPEKVIREEKRKTGKI